MKSNQDLRAKMSERREVQKSESNTLPPVFSPRNCVILNYIKQETKAIESD